MISKKVLLVALTVVFLFSLTVTPVVAETLPGIPYIKATLPADETIGAPLNEAITLVFNEDLSAGTNFNGITLKSKSNGSVIPVTKTFGGSGIHLFIRPDQALSPLKSYSVYIPADSLRDADGNKLDRAYIIDFTTNNGEPAPKIITPADGTCAVPVNQSIYVSFSEAVSQGPDFGGIALKTEDNVVPTTITLNPTGLLTVDPVTDLLPGKTYSLTVPAGAVVDTEGKQLTSPINTSFNTYITSPSLQVNIIPTFTNQPAITITGTITAGTTVMVNGEQAGVSGTTFSKIVNLVEGTNIINVVATDANGNTNTLTRQTVLDQVAPTLEITSPTDGTQVLTNSVVVQGTAEPGSHVFVNGDYAPLDPSGAFAKTTVLKGGTNVITVTAQDNANITSVSRTVNLNVLSNLTISPNPIRLGTSATIRYSLADAAYMSINIYNEKGDLVRTLLNNVKKLTGSCAQIWDGKDNNGILVPEGNYKFVLEARDASSAVIGYAEKSQLAAYFPTISNVTASPSPFNPLTGEQANINYTISKDALVTVQILKSNTPVRTLILGQAQAAGVNTVTWDGKDDNGVLLGDGTYYYLITAVSPTVASFKITSRSTVVLEKDNPQITNFSTGPNPYKIGTSLTIRYTLSENCKVTLTVLDSAGNVVRTLLNSAAKNAGFNTAVWNGKNDSGIDVPEGQYSVRISAVDNYAKPSEVLSVTFTAAAQPAISGVSVSPSPFSPSLGQAATINYTVSKDAVVTVQILEGTRVIRTLTAAQNQTAGSYSVEWDGKDSYGNSKAAGTYSCQITATSPTVPTFKSAYKTTVTIS